MESDADREDLTTNDAIRGKPVDRNPSSPSDWVRALNDAFRLNACGAQTDGQIHLASRVH